MLFQRARAFKIKPYPCIGQVSFLDFYLTNHPAYAEVLQRIKTGHSFLDAGCCLGQSLRRLLFDGAPSSNALYGLDIEPAFFDLGHDLFRDRDRMHATFITADLTDPFVTAIEPFTSKIDIISAIGFFHLFNLEDQKTVAQHLASLTTPIAGSMIIGLHIGTIKAVERHAGFQDSDVFFHDLESFEQLWQDVGTATGTKWKVDARVEELPDISKSRAWCKPDTTRFIFTVRRE